ncbi:3-deoxy-D-manno-octulosonic acid kinase [Planctomycetes bacterium Poly30]|uniref:3-deoxy-D-manno-octulosonic acid kinase n=2 Tax=Saltatorellus ferox TaxID=2528018 RepID=A0A518EX06_9BACT|nr:3-deoxy-D-manno-octulosonic acid kinase [Planctomycetes bacterium Poly30]
MACRAADEPRLAEAGFTADGKRSAEALADAEESGREPLGLLEVGGVTCLARRFTHGGLARALTGARFRDPARPFEELVLSERLRALGIRTPRVIAARAVAVPPVGYELTIVTERMDGVRDLGWMLGDVRRGGTSHRTLQQALESAGRLIADLHRVGFLHADLQPANLLIESANPAAPATAIDLDRSSFVKAGDGRGGEGAVEPLPESLVHKNLGRLWRHVARREAEYGATLSRADRVRFLKAYGVPRDQLAPFSAAIASAAESKGLGHRIGWWIERYLGRGPDRRAAAP